MEQLPKISVVVPVYKAEKFLHSCVESILAQTFENFELLLVDDGSPDNSGKICDEYAKNDGRVQVFHIANGGANRARALGVAHAKGEYVTFVDSDDSLPPYALHELYGYTDEQCDIVIGTYDRNPKQYTDEQLDKLELVRRLYYYTIASSPYAKLFRRELFDEKTFDLPRDFVMGEDFVMNVHLAFACQHKIRVIPTVVYCYNDNAEGIVNTFDYTLDYLERSYHYKKNAIPKEYREVCMPYCIANILMMNSLIMRHYYMTRTWTPVTLHRQIVEDIKTYDYRGSAWERFALRFSNPVFGAFYLMVQSVERGLKQVKRMIARRK